MSQHEREGYIAGQWLDGSGQDDIVRNAIDFEATERLHAADRAARA